MLAQFYPPVIGGEERHVRNLSVEFARRGHDVHVGTLRLDSVSPHAAQHDAGVTVHSLDSVGRRLTGLYASADRPLAMPMPDPVLTRALHRLVDDVRPDVVHAHNWIVNSYLPVQWRHRRPLVLSLHDYSHVCATKRSMLDDGPCPGPAPRRCLGCVRGHYGTARGGVIWATVRAGIPARERLVDVFTPVSRAVASASRLAEAGVDFEVVPNFVPDALASAPLNVRDPALPAEPYLFFAGDLSAQKGLLTLLDAYTRLDGVARPPLVLVGRPTPDLPERLPPGVQVELAWDHDRVVSGFQYSLAAVLPSEWPDPCPTTVLEAMALGAPLVTTHQGGIADMVVPDESALVVAPADPAQLAAALARVIAEPALRRRLVDGGRGQVQAFRLGSVADRLTGIYESVGKSVRKEARHAAA